MSEKEENVLPIKSKGPADEKTEPARDFALTPEAAKLVGGAHARMRQASEQLGGVCAERAAAEERLEKLRAEEARLVDQHAAAKRDLESAGAALRMQLGLPVEWVLDLDKMCFVHQSTLGGR